MSSPSRGGGGPVEDVRGELVARGLVDGLPRAFLAGVTRFARPPQAELDGLTAAAEGLAARLAAGEAGEDDLPLLTRVLFSAGHGGLLAACGVRTPSYDVLGSYRDNLRTPIGPRLPERPRAGDRRWRVLGRDVGFPVGVPACVLNGGEEWVRLHAGNGFSVLTYKTVRSRAHEPNAQPNWTFAPRPPGDVVVSDPWDWVEPGSPGVSTVNSFGVPSPAPEEWGPDLERSLAAVDDDQLLLVSVMGEGDGTALVDDFARTALLAQEAGATVVELNLSCPNTLAATADGVKPPLCLDAGATLAVVEGVRRALDDRTGLVAKLSWLDEQRLAALVPRLGPLVDGVAGINTVPSRVVRSDGEPTFPGRAVAGLSGAAVRGPALDLTRRLVALREAGGHSFAVLAMGGVTDVASFAALYEAGADAVQSASGAFADPFLARDCIAALGDTLPRAVAR
ncbi:dihydroorotate dehydrogenase [Geodermatophilus bullaregiensis]|uniref:dihydroorotate oxidase n=1 Tax=Geodermatophilus bullaregiensis TaxID=1564160 RepID=UPI0027DC1A26|nr:dihydroorotate oxidase [Geodermatophilus bullaregiensis]MBM7804647.1 dihydroorotate dehydrogenase [Geodermatophilus bullaregiensis]